MQLVSLFSGAGGLDLGFTRAGFNMVWANDHDKAIWETYEKNHDAQIIKSDIRNIPSTSIPTCDGIIGGPPCQSWSAAGALRGINDSRGRLFYEFIRILDAKRPLFFVVENVSGMLARRNTTAVKNIVKMLNDTGYKVFIKVLNAADYEVAQDRKRVFYVGFLDTLNMSYEFPFITHRRVSLKDAIWDLQGTAVPAGEKNHARLDCKIPNHEYMHGGFSTMYMSRNRVRGWDEQSFVIQAGGRHAPIHPQAPRMIKVTADAHCFDDTAIHLYRRLSVRECARIQSFPDDFIFYYKRVADGYKMVGNAVPVNLAYHIACSVIKALQSR